MKLASLEHPFKWYNKLVSLAQAAAAKTKRGGQMSRLSRLLIVLILTLLLSACMSAEPRQPDLSSLDVINNVEGDLIIRRQTEDIWIYTAYLEEASKNGLLVESASGIGIIDPPDNLDQAERLNALIEEYFNTKVNQVLWTGRILSRQPVCQFYQNEGAEVFVIEAVAVDEGLKDVSVFRPNEQGLNFADKILKPLCFRQDGTLEELHISLWLEESELLYAGPNLISPDIEMIMTPVYESVVWETIVGGLASAVPAPAIVVTNTGAAGGVDIYEHTKSLILEREFTLTYGAAKLPLRTIFEDDELLSIFGKPEKIEESILGIGADTFIGSTIRTFTFNKSQVSLFAPSGSEKFWLSSVVSRDPRFSTSRGINVGESLTILMLKYPEAEPVPNEETDPGNMDYIYDHGTQGEYALYFEVRAGVIDKISLVYTLR